MDSRTLLIFDLGGARFGVDATRVRETVWLPELTPLEEAPPWVAGVFSLRGVIVPVIDLHLRFGHGARRYRTGDQVVVLDSDHMPLGLIVGEVREVVELPAASIQPPLEFGAAAPDTGHLVAGEARVGDGLVTLLDVARLTRLPEGETIAADTAPPAVAACFCPQADAAERALFHARAQALRQATVDDAGTALGLAVLELGGEYFGVELAAVQEFCTITQLTPVPCCPPHILGAMSLRGNLITLIDPRAALNLAPAGGGAKAVVARLGAEAVALAVDAVHDVVYLRGVDLQPPPAALRERSGAEITATAPYAGRMMTVLDLPALLAREEWIVEDHV